MSNVPFAAYWKYLYLHLFIEDKNEKKADVTLFALFYRMSSLYSTLCLYCFYACMLASVLIGLSDEMLLRAVVIAQYPNWHHSLSTSSPWREFDLSGVTTMCYHPAQSVI